MTGRQMLCCAPMPVVQSVLCCAVLLGKRAAYLLLPLEDVVAFWTSWKQVQDKATGAEALNHHAWAITAAAQSLHAQETLVLLLMSACCTTHWMVALSCSTLLGC